MKVVQITPYFRPSRGGIANIVSELMSHSESPIETEVICQKGASSDSVTVLDLDKGRFIIKALESLKRLQPKVIHCHSHWHMLAPAVTYKRFNRKTRIIFTFHTEPPDMKRGVKTRILERMLSKCDTVTFVSESLRRSISKLVRIKARQEVVYPGVKAKTVQEEEISEFRNRYDLNTSDPILAYVGLLEWKKKVEGLKMLLEAIYSIVRVHPSIRLVVVGDGSRRGEVEDAVAKLGLSKNVIMAGLVNNVFVPLQLCDFYVHISLQESLGQTLLEAMSLGKPVIASNVGGIPEVVRSKDVGILVEPDVDNIASSILHLMENPNLAAEIGEQAKAFVESEFSWEKMARQYADLYISS